MITLINALLKAIKGQSLIFALLFTFALLGGISLAGVVRSFERPRGPRR